MSDNIMDELKTDKLLEAITFRCPEFTKALTDKLSPTWKKKLNEALLIATARILHDAAFDPSIYLKSE
jgi:hypothetical protein